MNLKILNKKLCNVMNMLGTLVGESTSREFRLAVAHEMLREQDIIAVDAELRRPEEDQPAEKIRVWAKVQRIERLNPLFPSEQVTNLLPLVLILLTQFFSK